MVYGETEPWIPMSDPVDLKYLGKFIEELGEGTQAAGRCLIQGMDQFNEKEGHINKTCLEDEIADIEANIKLVKERFGLDEFYISMRVEMKLPKLRAWHDAI